MRKILLLSAALTLVLSPDVRAGKLSYSNLSASTSPLAKKLLQNTVEGTVSDIHGPVVGVSVSVVGGAAVVVTDSNGKFRIDAPIGATLRFSSIGFATREIKVTSQTMNVVIEAEDNVLDQVVVVGYGTQKKSHLTGAVSSINMDEVVGSRPIPDVGRGLQGVAPGLSVVIPSGEVGSDPIIKIRGQVGSVRGSSDPLILVDNVEIPSISLVNPDDIASITILKDAASSSIYGSKAAFGVVLITTKIGSKTESTNITYSNNSSWQKPFKDIEVAGIDGLEYTLEAHENMKASGPAGGFWRVSRESLERIKEWQVKYGGIIGNDDPVVYNRDWYYNGTDKFGLRIYDPVEAMVKKSAFSQNHNLGINGRRKDTDYSLSLGYLGQEGMMKPAKHDDFRRLTTNLRLSTKATDFLTVRGGVMYSDKTKRSPNSNTGYGADPWLYLYRWSRLFPTAVQEHGNDIRDPYFDTKKAHDLIKQETYLNLNIGTTIDLTNKWNIIADYAYSSDLRSDRSSMPTFTGAEHWYTPSKWIENGSQVYVDEEGNRTNDILDGVEAYRFPVNMYVGKDKTYIYKGNRLSHRQTFNAYSTYNLDFNAHQLKFMVGTNIVSFKWDSYSAEKTDLINNDNPQFNFAVGKQFSAGNAHWESQVGFFGRTNYAFNDKYLFELNLRSDAASKFPSHMQWRWFPSVSAGWVLTNEEFMKSLNPVLSFAKIRGSWGSIGDQSVANDLYLETMNIVQNSWLSSTGDQYFQLGTPKPVSDGITWQDIVHVNLGADLRFFGNKLGLGAEVYQRDTRNMIIGGDALPATFGASAPEGNYGNLRTRGWELEVDYNHQLQSGFRFSASANLSDAKTMITKGADWQTPWENRAIHNSFTTGKRWGDVYGYVTDRLYQKEDFVYDDNGQFVQTTIVFDGVSKVTNVQVGQNPVYQTYFEDGNQTLLMSPGDVKFVDVNGDGYITAGKNTFGDPGDQVVIGNSTPRYQYGFRLGAEYKSFDFSVFTQGVGKRSIWGDGQLAIPGYHVKDGAMPQVIAGDFWKEDRTDAFYPRAWNLGGANSGYTMRPQTKYMLDMSYIRIKNITFGYALPAGLLKRAYLTKARVFVSLENFFSFDNLRGLPIDPEAINGYSVLKPDGGYNLNRTSASNPAFKSAAIGIQIGL